MPSIGYGSNKKTRHVMPNGFKRFLVNNENEVELLLMHSNVYAGSFIGLAQDSTDVPQPRLLTVCRPESALPSSRRPEC